MKTLFYILLTLLIVICLPLYLYYEIHVYTAKQAVTSSPVKEMYHRELVSTIDSILNARDCIEPDDISVKHDSLGRVIMPD